MRRHFILGFLCALPLAAQDSPAAADQRKREMEGFELSLAYEYPVKNAPYSADAMTTTTQTLGDGNRIERTTTQKLYRDSEGRERREQSVLAVGALAQTNMPHLITILDSAGVLYTLNPETHTAQRGGATTVTRLYNGTAKTFYFADSGKTGLFLPDAAETAGYKEDLGSKTIEGVTAQGTRSTETIPAGQIGNVLPIKIVDEVWYSPDLKMNVLTTHTDPRSGEVVYKLTNIQRGEQPKSLFEPPADYTVTGSPARK